jgi:hypothetical protein
MVPRIALPAPAPCFGIDTVATITPEFMQEIQTDPRVRFIGRYVDGLTSAEVDLIVGAQHPLGGNYFLTLFTYADELTPAPLIAKLNELAIPSGVTIWEDIESETMNAIDLMTAINFCGKAFKTAGFDAGEYAGAGEVLTSAQLTSLVVDIYMKSCSKVLDAGNELAEPASGYTGWQGRPNSPFKTGSKLIVDWEAIMGDYLGRLPVMVTAAPTLGA